MENKRNQKFDSACPFRLMAFMSHRNSLVEHDINPIDFLCTPDCPLCVNAIVEIDDESYNEVNGCAFAVIGTAEARNLIELEKNTVYSEGSVEVEKKRYYPLKGEQNVNQNPNQQPRSS